jgi:hypothetical protein
VGDDINKEFASYRSLFKTEKEKVAFDQHVKTLLETHGVDYVRDMSMP